jgi:hypothetical protein
MSAIYVRDTIKQFIKDELPTEEFLVDFTAEYRELADILTENKITRKDKWLGIQFIGNNEEPITIAATNDTGRYREEGAAYIHIIDTASIGVGNRLLVRAEEIRNLFRGRRIDKIRVDRVTPPNFDAANTLQFEGGWTSCSVLVFYEYDLEL